MKKPSPLIEELWFNHVIPYNPTCFPVAFLAAPPKIPD
jgi:hypothetical protein